jgi:hypothetical protein
MYCVFVLPNIQFKRSNILNRYRFHPVRCVSQIRHTTSSIMAHVILHLRIIQHILKAEDWLRLTKNLYTVKKITYFVIIHLVHAFGNLTWTIDIYTYKLERYMYPSETKIGEEFCRQRSLWLN